MADKVTVVPPRDPCPFSTVAVEDLKALVVDGLLHPLSGGPQPEWMAPASEADPTLPPGHVVSFIPFHERGFGVPASRFMRALLHYYGVELHNFNPNSIAQAAIFAAVCEGFFGDRLSLGSVDPSPLREALCLDDGGKEGPYGGAGRWLHRPAEARAHTAVHPRHPCVFEQGVAAPVVLSPERRREASSFSQRVVTAAGSNWRWGATREKQEMLQPLLDALQNLRDEGLTAAGVVAAIHRWRVLPLAERRLQLSKMKPGVDLEGSQMSSASLSTDDLRRRVAGTVGRLDAGALTQPVMRPERGYVSLVSVRSFSCFAPSCL
jgi:hypothetical protein